MTKHIPVLLDEVIRSLNLKTDGIYLDLTLGRAGHSKEILKHLITGKLIGFDKDQQAIKESEAILKTINNNFVLINNDFKNVVEELKKINVSQVDGILADLGVSSPQLDDPSRGFSYTQDVSLDMRMDLTNPVTAKKIVNEASLEELVKIFKENADIKLAHLIAKAIIKNRPIQTSLELSNLLKEVLPAKVVREKNPSKQVFQALRIAVNDELNSLQALLDNVTTLMKVNSKLLIITFHSKEDKIVKDFYKKLTYTDSRLNKLPINEVKKWHQKIIFPTDLEKENNRRSKSAKLRIITRLG